MRQPEADHAPDLELGCILDDCPVRRRDDRIAALEDGAWIKMSKALRKHRNSHGCALDFPASSAEQRGLNACQRSMLRQRLSQLSRDTPLQLPHGRA